MTEQNKIPPPGGICAKCQNDKTAAVINRDANCIAAHCSHNLTGGIYQADVGRWHLYTPISREKFFELLAVGTAMAKKDAGLFEKPH